MVDMRVLTGVTPARSTQDNDKIALLGTRDGAAITADWLLARAMEGRAFGINGGSASTPITFAGAYDADAPDAHIHVPYGTTIVPYAINVCYEAVGTEVTMEIIALASSTGDSSATGTAATIKPLRLDAPVTSNCTATVAIDAAGITDPNAGTFFEFWRFMRPLTDTVASGENDRLPLVFSWAAFRDTPPPMIVGTATTGACLAVYATSQAGTGFITVQWVEVPSTMIA